MPSTITTPVAFRIPNDVLNIVEKRAKKQSVKTGEYLRNLITNDARRKR